MNWLLGLFSGLWRESTRQQVYRLAPLAILLLATGLRFHQIDQQSLWNDEGNSLRLAERAIPDLIGAARLDIHPPGYYLALKAWITVTGESEFALRSLSALFSVLAVACVYALGKKLFAQGAGTVAALLVALNTFNIYYGQEARMYAALALFAAASMWTFICWIDRPSWRSGIALALLNAAGLYTQYSYPAVMLTQGILFALLWLHRRDRMMILAYVTVNLLTIGLFVPQIGPAIVQISGWPRTGEAVPVGSGLLTVAQWLTYGSTTGQVPWWAYLWPTLFVLAAILPDWIHRPRTAAPSWWRRLLPWLWLLITIGPLFALDLFRTANLKFLLPVQIAWALLIGRGIWLLWEIGSPMLFIFIEALPRLAAGLGLLSMITFASDVINNLYTDAAYTRPNYRAIARTIAYGARLGDAIVLDAPNQQEVFSYYYHGDAPIYALPRGLGGDDAATSAELTTVITQYHRIFVLYWGETERDPHKIVEKTLSSQAFAVNSTWYGDVRFTQYATLPATSELPIKIAARFGASIMLASASLTATTVSPGDALGVTLNWSTDQHLDRRYKVFVQLLNTQGVLAAQHDSEPGNYLAITTTWTPGQTITDMHGLGIPADLPSGDYQLIVGMYDSEPPQMRLPVNNSDHVELGTIHVLSK